MSALLLGALAVLVTASVTLPVGWWLGSRRRSAREAALRIKLAERDHLLAAEKALNEVVRRHAASVMADVVQHCADLLRERGPS